MSLRTLVAGTPLPPDFPVEQIPDDLLSWSKQGVALTGPGVLSVGTQLLVVLPRGHRPSQTLEDATRVVASLAQYRRDPHRRSVEDQEAVVAIGGEDQDPLDRLEAQLLLLEDWRQRGPLPLSRRTRGVDRPGRIHWGRSERIGAPIDTGSGLAFARLVTERVQVRADHPLIQLHRRMCLNLEQTWTGHPSPTPLAPRREAESVLRAWERRVFADRPRRVIQLMWRVLRGGTTGGPRSSELTGLVARRFAMVWERMLQVALGHQSLKQPWSGRIETPSGEVHGLSLRPDLMVWLSHPERALVLDAKDYARGSWPATADLTKQGVYRLLTRAERPDLSWERIGNAFLFPGDSDPAHLRGVHRLQQPVPGFPELITVVGIEADVVRVMDAYRAGRVDRGLRQAVVDLVAEVFPGVGVPVPMASSAV